MNTRTATEQVDDELSLFDVFDFLLNNRLIIAAAVVAGILLAAIYLLLAPPVYEATLQVEMARLGSNGGGLVSDRDVRGTPVEDARLLVERLRLPSTYSGNSIKACNLQDAPFPSKTLANEIRSKVIKDVGSVAEITVPGKSQDAAKVCALTIFEMIQQQQNTLLSPYIREARENKASLEARLKDNQEFLEKMDKTVVQSAVYLAKRDESIWLMTEIANIERSLRKNFETRLVSPIYSTSRPVFPNFGLTLTIAALTGLILGIMLAFLRSQIGIWRRSIRQE